MVIHTSGYEGQSLKEILRRLKAEAIEIVVDVRELPLSRKPGFSKKSLAASLQSSGIGYLHLPELGCPKPVRNRYREDGDWARYTRAFLAHLKLQTSTIAQLADLAQDQSLTLLCYEADPERCHRTYVARAVAALTGGQVAHIVADGISREREIPAAA
jgi:uncharacterized protein (DUF488 family)